LLSKVQIESDTASGYNLVLAAFSRFEIGRDRKGKPEFSPINDQFTANGTRYDFDALSADISVLREQGASVLVSVGGDFAFESAIQDNVTADSFVSDLADAITAYNLSGVDFSHIQASADPDLYAYVIEELRTLLPDTIIIYTIPAQAVFLEPWGSILGQVGDFVDFVQVSVYGYEWAGYDYRADFSALHSLGIAAEKTLFGIMPGCHDASGALTTSADDSTAYTKYALDHGMAGVVFYSVNRDTDHRSVSGGCLYQSGQADGTYLQAAFAVISAPA
jgi:chitinase